MLFESSPADSSSSAGSFGNPRRNVSPDENRFRRRSKTTGMAGASSDGGCGKCGSRPPSTPPPGAGESPHPPCSATVTSSANDSSMANEILRECFFFMIEIIDGESIDDGEPVSASTIKGLTSLLPPVATRLNAWVVAIAAVAVLPDWDSVAVDADAEDLSTLAKEEANGFDVAGTGVLVVLPYMGFVDVLFPLKNGFAPTVSAVAAAAAPKNGFALEFVFGRRASTESAAAI